MNSQKEKYPPQIRALIEQVASEVIINNETTLVNVRINNKEKETLDPVEKKLKDFYEKIKEYLIPATTNNSKDDQESDEYKNLFGTEITTKTWRGYHGSAQEITE